jgi:hypothetical protein
MTTDSLHLLFQETRQSRPPVWQADEWQNWLQAIGQVIAAFPSRERQWAVAALVANDLVVAMPGLSLPVAYHVVEEAVQREHDLAWWMDDG